MKVHVSCVEKFTDKVEKPLVLDFLVEQGDQGVMVNFVEAGAYVSLDEPIDPCPFFANFSQGRVTTAIWSKPVAGIAEVRAVGAVVDGLQDHVHDLLYHLIPHAGHAQFAHLAVWSAKRSPSPPPIQNRACELLRTRLLSVWSHLIGIPSCSNFRIRSLNTVISASHSSWEYPSGSPLSDFFS